MWYYLMGEEQERKGAKGILGSGGSFHNGSETRKSMWRLAFISTNGSACSPDELATDFLDGWAGSSSSLNYRLSGSYKEIRLLGLTHEIISFGLILFDSVLGSMKCSLFRRNVWIFGPESNLKKLRSSGQDGQLGEGSGGRDPPETLAARGLLNGTDTEGRAAVAAEHLLGVRHREMLQTGHLLSSQHPDGVRVTTPASQMKQRRGVCQSHWLCVTLRGLSWSSQLEQRLSQSRCGGRQHSWVSGSSGELT